MTDNGEQAGSRRLQLDLKWLRTLGWSVDELLSGGLEALVHPEDGERTLRELEKALSPGGATDGFVMRLRSREGDYRWFTWRIRTAPDGSVECSAEDVTENRRAPSAIEDGPFRTMADASPALMWFADADGRFEFVNRAWLRFTGQSLDQTLGLRWLDGLHPADVRAAREKIEPDRTPEPFTLEYRRLSESGEARWLFDSAVPRQDPSGAHIGWMGTCIDIHERKTLEHQLRHQADHDALTGLMNRRRFEAELDRQLERTRLHGQPGAVLFADIDRFKQVNDTYGHSEGDRVLVSVASALRDRVRSSDLVARLGGDEFAIVLARVTPAQSMRVGESLVEAVRHREPGTTISIGVAPFDSDFNAPIDELLTAADRALYAAKADGRDRVAAAGEAAVTPARIPD